uniref:CD225/dispanin family protein n=1 Tax=uncultured Muribaculaceae bacterium TaxID=2301481 RepID=A0A6G8F3T7_9BACT|nr:hypothetical protein Muribac1_0830 [uncultured Muribaculaceae bacterium]
MRKIAIFTSGSGEIAERLVSLFNDGDRFRVDVVVTERENTGVEDRLAESDTDVVMVERDKWREHPEEILELLKVRDIELIGLDGFKGLIPRQIYEKFGGKIVDLTDTQSAPGEIAAAVEKSDSVNTANVESPAAEESKGVDEEWAETLHMNFDPSRLRSTPPPVPGAGNHQAPESQPPHASNPGQQAPQAQPYFRNNPYYGGDRTYYSESRRGEAGEREAMPSTWLVWSVLMTVFCCTIPGIVAIIFSSQVSAKYGIGDIEGAKRASRNAEIWIIVSFVLGVLSSTLYLPFMMAF